MCRTQGVLDVTLKGVLAETKKVEEIGILQSFDG